MKKLDFHTFHIEAFMTYPFYKTDNSWFRFESEPQAHTIYSCWLAYQKTDAPSAGMLLLGDTKIRSDHELVFNFGLSSANGVQEEETRREVEELQNRRTQVAAGAGPGAFGPSSSSSQSLAQPASSPSSAIQVVGSGSILSTKGWTPMLNDSFIIGGVHSEHDFHLALSPDEQAIFNGLNSGLPPKDLWREFFRRNPVSFWNSQYSVPRVFAREVLGLAAFGYEPEFSKVQLSFHLTNKGASDAASLDKYCEALRKAKMTPVADKAAVIQAIANFVFKDAKALDA
jgi:hypothetical protein